MPDNERHLEDVLRETIIEGHSEKHDREREIRLLRQSDHVDLHRASDEAHREKHESERDAVARALDAEQRRLVDHAVAHDAAHAAHEALHQQADLAHAAMHDSETTARTEAVRQLDKRLDQMNEFREQLRDQAATFVRREVLDTFEASIEKRLDEMRNSIQHEREERRANEGSRGGVSSTMGWIIGAIGAAVAALTLINLLTGPNGI